MKDSREYSKKIRVLYRSLKRKYAKPQKVFYENMVDALVYAIVCERVSETSAQAAIKRFSDYFNYPFIHRISRKEFVSYIFNLAYKYKIKKLTRTFRDFYY